MTNVPITPLGDRVVARGIETDNKTASGLYLPDGSKEKSKIAEVVAVGKDTQEVKVGDKIAYKEYATTDIKINDVDYIILKLEDVLATIK